MRNLKPTLQDILFWLFIFLYTDIGGFQKGYFQNDIFGRIDFSDVIFVIVAVIFLFIPRRKTVSYTVIRKFLMIYFLWFLYYVLVYGYLNNTTDSFDAFLLKSRNYYYNLIIMFFVSYVIQRDSRIFFKCLIYFSYTVIGLLIITILTNIELIPINIQERELFTGTRYLLYNYGLMPMLIPLAIVVLLFKTEIKEKNLLMIGGSLMLLLVVLSLTRRQFFFSLFYLFIIFVMAVRLKKTKVVNMLKFIKILIIPLVLVLIFFPKYIDTTKQVFVESFSVLKTSETTSGHRDIRLSLTKNEFMLSLIEKSPYFGTGYERRWATTTGDSAGYEASDYPFIGAIAMYGLIGLLCYIPVYFFIYKRLFSIFSKIKRFGSKLIFYNEYDSLLFYSLFSMYFLDLLKYMYYFGLTTSPSSSLSGSIFIQLGLLLGIFQKTQYNLNINKLMIH